MDNFEICDYIPSKLKKVIKAFYVFDDSRGYNVLFITIDDKVFGFGSNFGGVCGLGHEMAVKEPKLIQELCDKRVEQFFSGMRFALALTSDNKVYGWGGNNWGQLARSFTNINRICRPFIISHLSDINIKQVCCGRFHTLVLSSEGMVSGWGDNKFGQLGGQTVGESGIIRLKTLPKIRTIQCSSNSSFAITDNGLAYVWGENTINFHSENVFVREPKLIPNLKNVKMICGTETNTYFLSFDGKIYFCNKYFDNYKKLSKMKPCLTLLHSRKFLKNNKSIAIGFNKQGVYVLDSNKLIKTQFTTIGDFLCKEHQVTFNTIHIIPSRRVEVARFHQEVASREIARSITMQYLDEIVFDRSEFLSNFSICKNLNQDYFNIKYLHVFDDNNGYNVLFITYDDNVFGFGSNQFGCCGLGHNKSVKDPQLIPEICEKSIKKFYTGLHSTFGMSEDGELFGWGDNSCGQLTIPDNPIKFYEPIVIEVPDGMRIKQISCGSLHVLVLTTDGIVYGWGNNNVGQLGCGNDIGQRVYAISRLSTLPRVKSILCGFAWSFALTEDGFVYSWGYVNRHELGYFMPFQWICEPRLISDLPIIKSICSSTNNTYFLTNEGDLYFCGKYFDENNKFCSQLIPILLITDVKFDSLFSTYYYQKSCPIGCAMSDNKVFALHYNKVEITSYKTIEEYYSSECQLTYKTYLLRLQSLISEKNMIIKDNEIDIEYEVIEEIASGQFGTVYKVLHHGQIMALKKFNLTKYEEIVHPKYVICEIETLSKIKDIKNRIVTYYNSWIDTNNDVFIAMELCADSLKNILESKHLVFNRSKTDKMCKVEYYVTCLIFVELLEAVQYLHDQQPPIIHRDLKPANILFAAESNNGIFFKLCDFGLAVLDDGKSHTRAIGTLNYMAPEIWQGGYDVKSDVYSLAKIGQEMFQVNLNLEISNEVMEKEFREKFEFLENLLEDMTKQNYKKRINCSDVLEQREKWTILGEMELSNKMKDHIKRVDHEVYPLKIYLDHLFRNSFN